MAYQLSTVRDRIQRKLDNTSFETNKLNDFINDGQRYIFNKRRFTFMEREDTVTTSDGSDQLGSYPTDIQVPITLRLYSPTNYARALTYIEYESFDESIPNPNLTGEGPPIAWTIFNGTPQVYPVSDTTYTLALRYLKKPAELVDDTDVPEIPEEFSETLVLAGYMRALEHDDDFDQAQVIQLKVDEQVQDMDERYNRQRGTVHTMRQPWRATRRKIGGL